MSEQSGRKISFRAGDFVVRRAVRIALAQLGEQPPEPWQEFRYLVVTGNKSSGACGFCTETDIGTVTFLSGSLVVDKVYFVRLDGLPQNPAREVVFNNFNARGGHLDDFLTITVATRNRVLHHLLTLAYGVPAAEEISQKLWRYPEVRVDANYNQLYFEVFSEMLRETLTITMGWRRELGYYDLVVLSDDFAFRLEGDAWQML